MVTFICKCYQSTYVVSLEDTHTQHRHRYIGRLGHLQTLWWMALLSGEGSWESVVDHIHSLTHSLHSQSMKVSTPPCPRHPPLSLQHLGMHVPLLFFLKLWGPRVVVPRRNWVFIFVILSSVHTWKIKTMREDMKQSMEAIPYRVYNMNSGP